MRFFTSDFLGRGHSYMGITQSYLLPTLEGLLESGLFVFRTGSTEVFSSPDFVDGEWVLWWLVLSFSWSLIATTIFEDIFSLSSYASRLCWESVCVYDRGILQILFYARDYIRSYKYSCWWKDPDFLTHRPIFCCVEISWIGLLFKGAGVFILGKVSENWWKEVWWKFDIFTQFDW